MKKFRRETGADKKTSMDYLRKNGWNYGTAIKYYNISKSLEAFDRAIELLEKEVNHEDHSNHGDHLPDDSGDLLDK